MNLGLDGLTVFLTGASGGIGQALLEAFLGEGANVVACARREVEARDRVLFARADVRDPGALAEAMKRAVARFGRVDVCVANAGIWPETSAPLHSMDEARIREVIETNLLGAMWTARAFLASLASSGPRSDGRGASLTFIGSTAGRFGEAGHSEYSATKAAMAGLTRSLKNEIVAIDPRARVNLIEPGWTATPMAVASLEATGVVDRVTRTMPLRQIATPEDVARAVLFMSSPLAARHVSGEILTVAGGMEGRQLWG